MSSIDERVVEMKFNNSQFQKGVQDSTKSLADLKSGLNLDASAKSLNNLNAAGSRFSLAGIAAGVGSIASKFSALSIAGVAALGAIGVAAVAAGTAMVKSLTIDPVMAGLREYETKLGSIQTIMANTQAAGTTLEDVTGTLNELNEYSDKTIYNFAEMARNIGTFTAAGVDLETSAASIKGIANLAALSGSNSQQASTAMYQLSQAISSGKVSLMDWNSVVNAGMGGTVFQRALAETAVKMGTIDESAVKLEGKMKNVKISGESFRNSISAEGGKPSWLTSDVLTSTLQQFTGDMSKAELAAQGFSKAQVKAIMKTAETAQEAATVVKTGTQLIGTLQESAGSGWAQTWETIFGDFNEAKKLWTAANDTIGGMIQKSADARNKMFTGWDKAGGRDAAIVAISNAFEALMAIIGPVKRAFREIFPATTGKQLANITKAIRDFTEGLKPGNATLVNLQRTAKGFFAVLDIGWMVIKEVVGVIFDLIGVASDGTGGILEFTAGIGDFLVKVRDAIKNGEGLSSFFDGLGGILQVPIRLLQKLGGFLGDIFSGFDSGAAEAGLGRVSERLKSIADVGDVISAIWDGLGEVFSGALKFLEPLSEGIQEFFGGFGDLIGDSLAGADFSTALDVLNTGLLAAIALMIKNFLGGGFLDPIKDMFSGGGEGGGIIDTIKETFGGLTDTLGAMQAKLKSETLLKIAGAIALLTVSVVALSMIDSKKLAKALTAITVMFTQLGTSMAVFEKMAMGPGFAKMPVIASAMILLSTAVLILSAAVKNLSDLDWNELAKGLTGVSVILGALAVTARVMSKHSGGLISAGAGMILLAAAIKILASAVKDFSELSWEDLAKGLGSVSVVLASLAIFSKFQTVGKGAVAQAAGLVILAASLKIFASAVKDFSEMKWSELALGLVGMAGALVIVAGAMRIMPPNMLLSAAALVVVAAALTILADALRAMSDMTWPEIAKGLTVLAGSLILIAGAMLLMTTAIPGALALIVVAGALSILAPVLVTFGEMGWDNILKGLTVLAGSLILIAGAMILMTTALPGAAALIVVATALRILAPVLLALGEMSWDQILRGLTMLAGVFVILGVAGLLLTPVIPSLFALGAAILLLGVATLAAGVGVLAFSAGLTGLAAAGAVGAAALVTIFKGLLSLIPFAMKQIGLGIIELANVIREGAPAIVGALVAVLMSLLKAIARLAPSIVQTLVDLVMMLVDVLVRNVPKLVQKGGELVVGILRGMGNNIGKIVDEGIRIVVKFIEGITRGIPDMVEAGVDMIVTFVESLASSIRNNSTRMNTAGGELADAIIDGMVGGIGAGIGSVISAARDMASSALSAAKDFLGINSPSKEFMQIGKWTNEGMANGLTKYASMSAKAGAGVGESALNAAKDILGINSPSKEFRKLGKYVNQGFARGLTGGSKAEVKAAYKTMKTMLRDVIKSTNQDVKEAEERLKKLTDARNRDNRAINKARRELAKARNENKEASRAYSTLTKNLDDESRRLQGIANRYEKVSEKLKNAREELDAARKTRDDYYQNIRTQYKDLEDVNGETKVEDFVKNLEEQVLKTRVYSRQLQKLRDMGLHDKLYKDLVEKGPDALPFVTEMIEGGKAGVKEVNELNAALNRAANKLADNASGELYQAGVDSAYGIVKGLRKQQDRIDNQMERIADKMVRVIKKKLGIRSPSKDFAKVGGYSTDGLVKGLSQSSKHVEKAAEGVGETALDALKRSMSNLGMALYSDMDMQPTIKPVLDLSDIQKNSSRMGRMLEVDGSYAKASILASKARADQEKLSVDTESGSTSGEGYSFVQNNYSPKALSKAEIYRQTKNQLSVAKGALTK